MHKCKKCKYKGKNFIFQFTDYTYCVASNNEVPEYLNLAPKWVNGLFFGDAEIGEPVGCPKCHIWGVSNFEII